MCVQVRFVVLAEANQMRSPPPFQSPTAYPSASCLSFPLQVRFVVLDEADQMLNVGFEKDVETILENVPQASGAVGNAAVCSHLDSLQGRSCFFQPTTPLPRRPLAPLTRFRLILLPRCRLTLDVAGAPDDAVQRHGAQVGEEAGEAVPQQ